MFFWTFPVKFRYIFRLVALLLNVRKYNIWIYFPSFYLSCFLSLFPAFEFSHWMFVNCCKFFSKSITEENLGFNILRYDWLKVCFQLTVQKCFIYLRNFRENTEWPIILFAILSLFQILMLYKNLNLCATAACWRVFVSKINVRKR